MISSFLYHSWFFGFVLVWFSHSAEQLTSENIVTIIVQHSDGTHFYLKGNFVINLNSEIIKTSEKQVESFS